MPSWDEGLTPKERATIIGRLRRRWSSDDGPEDVAETLGLTTEEAVALAASLGLPPAPVPKYLPTAAEIAAACARFRLGGKISAEDRLRGMMG